MDDFKMTSIITMINNKNKKKSIFHDFYKNKYNGEQFIQKKNYGK